MRMGSATQRRIQAWLPGEPPNFDPQAGVDEWSYRIHIGWLEGLTRTDRTGRTVPALAADWEADGSHTELVVRLRTEATWSDGRPITAEDVRFGVLRALHPDHGLRAAWQMYVLEGAEEYHKGRAGPPVGVSVESSDTVRFVFDEPVPYVPQLWTLPPFAPLRADVMDGVSAPPVTEMPSSGPFDLVEYREGDLVRLVRNDRYWDRELTPPDEVVVRLGGDPVERFLAGEVDLADTSERRVAEIDPDCVTRTPECSIVYMLVNAGDPQLADGRVRAAIAAAVEPEEVASRAAPACVPLTRLVPRSDGTSGYLAATRQVTVPRDADTAPLAGLSLSLLCGDNTDNRAEAEVVAGQLAASGADVRVVPRGYAERYTSIRQGDYQIAIVAWKADFDSPLAFLREHVSDRAAGNQSKWSDGTYNRLVAEARATGDPGRRDSLLARAEHRLLASHHVIPLLQRVRTWLRRPGLEGVVFRQAGVAPELRWASW
ncbi:peptide ABC transporter substrate-binding protein [Haloechinothrix sp. LS1_15]|uniref:peptide ABC transporter substrate-binding protein n=1 Tax=Haloechinothrix sp. LS1_15 TaxID=2652248 RepID=UPI0029484171|nr:peptide ABC transporter substrate-binding protein [Haloechinothrix sp. LS1_15]MDV6011969.1 peptide ABC transporter substrate-binding protein [Haloechinothrix sp. LS1_15]